MQRFLRRGVAVATMVLLILGALVFLFFAITTGGKGHQVAPVMGGMVAVLFGFPMVSMLVRNVQCIWHETE